MTTPQPAELTTAQRLLSLLDHLGIDRAHIGAQIPADLSDLVSGQAARVGGVVLCAPTRLDPVPFEAVADRVLMIASEHGLTDAVTRRAAKRLPGSRRTIIKDYTAHGWSDIVLDHHATIAGAMTTHLRRNDASPPAKSAKPKRPATGLHAGLSYRIEGQGPALLLLPFFLAPQQWTAAIPALASNFTVITVGGAHVGGVAALEDRAKAPSYRAMFRSLVDLLQPASGQAFLEVGCGSGALVRLLAGQLSAAQLKRTRITACDVNTFLLREAAALAKAEGLGTAIRFEEGSAEALPYPDESFDNVFSVTVLEECDADKAIAEMYRVTRPGGRVGIIVRSIDLPQWWNVKIPDELRAITDIPPQSVAPNGVADASLYTRMRRAGLTDLVCFPSLITLDRPGSPIWRYREDHVLSQLSGEKLATWRKARAHAEAAGELIMANPLHCAVGRKPVSG